MPINSKTDTEVGRLIHARKLLEFGRTFTAGRVDMSTCPPKRSIESVRSPPYVEPPSLLQKLDIKMKETARRIHRSMDLEMYKKCPIEKTPS